MKNTSVTSLSKLPGQSLRSGCYYSIPKRQQSVLSVASCFLALLGILLCYLSTSTVLPASPPQTANHKWWQPIRGQKPPAQFACTWLFRKFSWGTWVCSHAWVSPGAPAACSLPKNVWVGNDLVNISSGSSLGSIVLCLCFYIYKMEIFWSTYLKKSMRL